ncbi:MAG: hypothetical protein ABIH20_04905 [Candidatus Diapherotrites archaeon]
MPKPEEPKRPLKPKAVIPQNALGARSHIGILNPPTEIKDAHMSALSNVYLQFNGLSKAVENASGNNLKAAAEKAAKAHSFVLRSLENLSLVKKISVSPGKKNTNNQRTSTTNNSN